MSSIRVLIADDHELVRKGLAMMLDGTSIDIVAEASHGDEAFKMAKKHKPDVALLDVCMPEPDGLKTLSRMHRELPNMKVVMLSSHDNPTYVARSVALGASDFVMKGANRKQLISTIENAAKGTSPNASGTLHEVAEVMNAKKHDEDDVPLTNRESQVLRHVALGLSNKEIGQSLHISVETVKEHVQNILRKLSVTDRTQAAVWAVRRGLV